MKIERWLSYEDIEDENIQECPCDNEHYNFLIDELALSDKVIYGDMHQSYNLPCVPIFSDGYLEVSQRTWGSIMAAAMNIRLKEERFTYKDFYLEQMGKYKSKF